MSCHSDSKSKTEAEWTHFFGYRPKYVVLLFEKILRCCCAATNDYAQNSVAHKMTGNPRVSGQYCPTLAKNFFEEKPLFKTCLHLQPWSHIVLFRNKRIMLEEMTYENVWGMGRDFGRTFADVYH